MIKKVLILVFLFTSSCGYTPIYINKNLGLIEFSKIELSGNEGINKKLINILRIKESVTENDLQLILKSNYKITETSKDSKGVINSYRSSIDIQILIKENDKIKKIKNLSQSFNYNSLDSRAELIEYQNEIENNLINKIVEDIILFLSL